MRIRVVGGSAGPGAESWDQRRRTALVVVCRVQKIQIMRHVNGESVESATSTLPARNRCGITGISPVLENGSGATSGYSKQRFTI